MCSDVHRQLSDSEPLLQAYRVAHYELGPRQFWWYWCGGLKVRDAVVVALWLALNVLCVQQRICLELPRLLGIFSIPPATAWPILDPVTLCLLWRGPLGALLHGLGAVAVLPVLQEQ